MKKYLNRVFIDGLSGMAVGLFATLIIGTIIAQLGSFIPGFLGEMLSAIGSFAKMMMGAGIGVGVAYKLKKPPLVSISSGVSGFIGAFASGIISGNIKSIPQNAEFMTVFSAIGVGEPLGAFIASFVAIELGSLVCGKTKIDIILTPLVSIICGASVGLLIGPPISTFMAFIGSLINKATTFQPIVMGIVVAVVMGVCLTLPISSAAISVSLGLSGIAGGAAVVGCCCQMIGFAVMSFRENKWSGLISQGLGTSMLQMPNIIKRPVVWLPPIIASAILGPISALCGITCTAVGAGMGTSGLVGCLQTFFDMMNGTTNPALIILAIVGFHFVLPALICLAVSELMRKFGVIRWGDLRLDT